MLSGCWETTREWAGFLWGLRDLAVLPISVSDTSLMQRLSPQGNFPSTPETAFVCPFGDSSPDEHCPLEVWTGSKGSPVPLLGAAAFRSRHLHAVLVFLIPSTVSLFKILLGHVCAVIPVRCPDPT